MSIGREEVMKTNRIQKSFDDLDHHKNCRHLYPFVFKSRFDCN